MEIIHLVLSLILVLLIGPIYLYWSGQYPFTSDWRTANRESAHIAPDPLSVPEDLIQVYSARTFNWRGLFAVHCWISIKPAGAENYTVYQIAGWRKYSKLPVLIHETDIPDRYWFGNKPKLLNELRGSVAGKLIPRIAELSEHYRYQYQYILWPGPNSNSYIAHIGRHLPELKINLPSIALGKDYIVDGGFFARAPSGTGYQLSFVGVLGLTLARVEGIEFNFLTLNFGLAWQNGLIIKWPGISEFRLFGKSK